MKNLRASIALFMAQTPSELAGGFAACLGMLAIFAALWIISPN